MTTYDADRLKGDRMEGEHVEADAVTTGSIGNVTAPAKIGFIGDTHFGWDSSANGFVSDAELKSKLDGFAADMNDWGAEHVIHLGDWIGETPSKSESQQRITDFRNYLEPQLEMPIHYVWGNHEFQGDWNGFDWTFPPMDDRYSSLEDTYYTIDHEVVKLIVINNGANFRPTQYDWLESELQTTAKPVIIASHKPISIGTNSRYDSLVNSSHPEMEWKLPALLSEYENILFAIFGHSHHGMSTEATGGANPPTFNKPLVQEYMGHHHFYNHFPHGLGGSGSGSDGSYTPYSKLHVWPGELKGRETDGKARIEQSYAGGGAGFREYFEFPRSATGNALAEKARRNMVYHEVSSIESLDTWNHAGSGSMSLTGQGVALQAASGASSGGTARVFNKISPRTSGAGFTFNGDWSWPRIFRVVVEVPDTSNMYAYVNWGYEQGEHIGIKIEDGALYGTVHDGSTENTVQLESSVGTGRFFYEVKHFPDKPRVDFTYGFRGDVGNTQTTLTNNLPPANGSFQDQVPRIAVNTKEAVEKTLNLYEYELMAAPAMNFIQ